MAISDVGGRAEKEQSAHAARASGSGGRPTMATMGRTGLTWIHVGREDFSRMELPHLHNDNIPTHSGGDLKNCNLHFPLT